MNDIENLRSQLQTEVFRNLEKDLVIICVGTDRSTGDSLAPLVGQLLAEEDIMHFKTYGTLDDPIHAVNLEEKLKSINKIHKDAFIIGIDACLGRRQSIGKIKINKSPLKPGAGVEKDLPEVGDCSILGIVNVSGFMEFMVLQNTRLSLVMRMAKEIVGIVKLLDDDVQKKLAVSKQVPDISMWNPFKWKNMKEVHFI